MKVMLWVVGTMLALGVGAIALIDWLAPGVPEQPLVPATGTADPETGRRLFAAHCTGCHGADARGTDRGPPLIHPIYAPDHHSNLAFQLAVQRGVAAHHWDFGDMPAVPALDAQDAADVTAWIRREQRRAGIE